ncbi:hypothetical protein ElyMa_006785200 [Elysia marginata]|uniref:Uncharacterized protein n=1 Tax=Elysia marginata TaxID=1093978 RepID=A0AAV4J3M6_9GAST|nr:hypothetical protein ElyMa_006785200 [Elysia marginata]
MRKSPKPPYEFTDETKKKKEKERRWKATLVPSFITISSVAGADWIGICVSDCPLNQFALGTGRRWLTIGSEQYCMPDWSSADLDCPEVTELMAAPSLASIAPATAVLCNQAFAAFSRAENSSRRQEIISSDFCSPRLLVRH